jgi:RimJ/RimL family protein N-acetyltransferase
LTEAAASVDIRAVTETNVEDARVFDPPKRLDEFRAFLARGDRGWYGYVDGRWVHRSWLVHGPAVMRLWAGYGTWPVPDRGAYIHYCETTPEARGRGIYPAVLNHIARETGSHDLYITTDVGNTASRRGIEKAGFAEYARVRVSVRFGVGSQRVIQAAS